MSQTPFIETEALLAVMDDDEDRSRELLATMLPNELARFERQVDRLGELVVEARA